MKAQQLQLNQKPQEPSQNVVGETGVAYIEGFNINLRSGYQQIMALSVN